MKFPTPRIPRILFAVVAVACLSLEVRYMFWNFPSSMEPSGFSRSVASLADGLLMMLPFVFLRGRAIWLSLLPLLAAPVLIEANLMYLRNFGDVMAPALYSGPSAFDPIVIAGAANALRPGDIILPLLSGVAATALAVLRRPLSAKGCGLRFAAAYCALTLMAIMAQGFLMYRRYAIYNDNDWRFSTVKEEFTIAPRKWWPYFLEGNLSYYLMRMAPHFFDTPRIMSSEESAAVERFFAERASEAREVPPGNPPSNLIFIIVESWSPKVLDLPEAAAIAPTLLALAEDSASVYIPRVRCQAGVGRSADGQLLYNTGLLPLEREPFCISFAYKEYPALPRAFRHSVEIIGEDAEIWAHSATNRAYGFRGLVSNLARWEDVPRADSLIFKTAAAVADTIAEPFYMEITTLSTHDPFEDGSVELPRDISISSLGDKRDLNYVARFNMFDRSLSRFLNHIKDTGLYDRTLIVIASDHDINPITVSEAIYDSSVPVLILNSPVAIDADAASFRQTDVFPTILDLMDLRIPYYNTTFRGVGLSMTDSSPRDTVMARERELSELVITRRLQN